MVNKYIHYLPFLASGNRLLIISNRRYEPFESLKEMFAPLTFHKLDETFLDTLSETLKSLNIVILDTTEEPLLARKLMGAIQTFNPDIAVITISRIDPSVDELEVMREAFASLIGPFTSEELKTKLFGALGIFYVIKSIGRREIRIKNNAHEEIEKHHFLNAHQGNALFMIDDLAELNTALRSNTLSAKLLSDLCANLSDVSRIFGISPHLASVSPIIDDLVAFIRTIDLADHDSGSCKGLEYLSYLIDDISRNLLDLFVDRIIDNVNIFSHSLESNIEYIKNCFNKKELPGSEAEFFE